MSNFFMEWYLPLLVMLGAVWLIAAAMVMSIVRIEYGFSSLTWKKASANLGLAAVVILFWPLIPVLLVLALPVAVVYTIARAFKYYVKKEQSA